MFKLVYPSGVLASPDGDVLFEQLHDVVGFNVGGFVGQVDRRLTLEHRSLADPDRLLSVV